MSYTGQSTKTTHARARGTDSPASHINLNIYIMKTFEITMTTSYMTVIKVKADDINDVHDNLAAGDYDMELAEAEMGVKAMDTRESDFDVTELPEGRS